jgi:hypothetical protein
MVTLILSVLDVKVCWTGRGVRQGEPWGARCSKKRVEAETIADWMA